jgi:hypothetical protein
MARTKAGGQLGLRWTEEMQWEDVPSPIRERIRDQLGELLRGAAVRSGRTQEAADEQ